MRKMSRLLTILMICFLMLAPVASSVMAQEEQPTTTEEAQATNWGPLVFMAGFGIILVTGMMIYSKDNPTNS